MFAIRIPMRFTIFFMDYLYLRPQIWFSFRELDSKVIRNVKSSFVFQQCEEQRVTNEMILNSSGKSVWKRAHDFAVTSRVVLRLFFQQALGLRCEIPKPTNSVILNSESMTINESHACSIRVLSMPSVEAYLSKEGLNIWNQYNDHFPTSALKDYVNRSRCTEDCFGFEVLFTIPNQPIPSKVENKLIILIVEFLLTWKSSAATAIYDATGKVTLRAHLASLNKESDVPHDDARRTPSVAGVETVTHVTHLFKALHISNEKKQRLTTRRPSLLQAFSAIALRQEKEKDVAIVGVAPPEVKIMKEEHIDASSVDENTIIEANDEMYFFYPPDELFLLNANDDYEGDGEGEEVNHKDNI